jgi:hypothetical protein
MLAIVLPRVTVILTPTALTPQVPPPHCVLLNFPPGEKVHASPELQQIFFPDKLKILPAPPLQAKRRKRRQWPRARRCTMEDTCFPSSAFSFLCSCSERSQCRNPVCRRRFARQDRGKLAGLAHGAPTQSLPTLAQPRGMPIPQLGPPFVQGAPSAPVSAKREDNVAARNARRHCRTPPNLID